MKNVARSSWPVTMVLIITMAACARRIPPTAIGTGATQPPSASPPPPVTAPPAATTRPGPQRVEDNAPVPLTALAEDSIAGRSLDDLNVDSPLRSVFFPLDGFELDEEARRVVDANASVLRRFPAWTVTIEGHCDERGSAEYNLALGERRAVAVRDYLTSLGIAGDRLRAVSYGEEFPADPDHTSEAWAKNRRASFVITAK